jgi:UDPglucose 6-dehydrogenase
LQIIPSLRERGAAGIAFDPVANNQAGKILGEHQGLSYKDDPYEVLEGADALVLLTEWPLFRRPDFERMKALLKTPVVFDGRNQYNPVTMKQTGFTYHCVGRCEYA